MITMTSEADVAVLVGASASGEFDIGTSQKGQTREHILLSYTLGVRQTNVGVNKMNEKTVNYSQKQYNEIKTETNNFRQHIGLNHDKTPLISISGFNGDNMIERQKNML